MTFTLDAAPLIWRELETDTSILHEDMPWELENA